MRPSSVTARRAGDRDQPSSQRPAANWITPATLLAISSLTVMAGATVAPGLPAMRAHFADAPGVELSIRLVLVLPALAIVVAAPVAGYALDRWSRAPILATAICLYALGGAAAFAMDSLSAILITRAVLGVAVAFLMTGATALIADIYHGSARARFMGLQAASMAGGGVVFLLLGGVLAGASWRAPFLVYLVAVATLPGLARVARQAAIARSGSATRIAGTTVPEYAPRHLLVALYLIAFAGMMLFYLTPTQIPFLVEQRIGAGAVLAGIALAATTLAGSLASLSFARVRTRLAPPAIFVIVFALLGSGYLVTGIASAYAAVLAGLAIAGLGIGLLMPNLTSWLTSAVPPAVRARALGGLTTAIFLGQFVSPFAAQPVLARAGLTGVFLLAGGTSLVIAMGVLLLSRHGGHYPE
ncbi:MAG TPA: MFS transporter [Gemmatimonadaceae bacterium]|nr:MFS transporter [Gemmatimonadaceae bacterium]